MNEDVTNKSGFHGVVLLAASALVLAVLVSNSHAINADSLEGRPGTAYFRSDVADTASGPLYLNRVAWLYGISAANQRLMHLDNYGTGIIGYNRSLASPLFYGINQSTAQPWMEVRSDSAGPGLIRLHGNTTHPSTNDVLFIDQVSPYGTGLGVYNTKGTGIYVDHGGDKMGIRVENNFMSTGYGLWIDNQNTGTAFYVSDSKNGRMIVTSQDSANKPAITVGYKVGPSFRDSAMLYPWGLKSKKVIADSFFGRLTGTADSSVVAGKANLLKTGSEYQSGDRFLRTDKLDTARYVVFDSIRAGKIVDLNVALSTNANYLLYGSGYHSGTSYLRSDVPDTAAGPLWLNQVSWLYAEAPSGKQLMQWKNYGNGILGWNYSATSPMIYGVNSSNQNSWIEIRQDSAGPGLIRLHGNTLQSNVNDIMLIDQLGQYSRGITVYGNQGTGMYINYGGLGTAVRITNNAVSTGTGIHIDNQNTGTALYILDTKSGRVMVISQDSLNKPSITAGYKYGASFRDSAMLYPWGLRSKKVVADTLWGRLMGIADSAVIAGKTNLLQSGGEYVSGDKLLRSDKSDTAKFVVFDSIKAGKIVDLDVATSTNANYLLYGSNYYSGTSYLRSDAADTASGELYLNQVKWLGAEAGVGKQMMVWRNYGLGITGWNFSATSPLIYGTNATTAQPWMEVRSDSAGPGLIRLHGNTTHPSTNDVLFIDQVSPYGTGLGVYNTKGTGIYVDHGGDKMGIRVENNFMSTGYGLWIDNQNTGTAFYVSDTKNGRMIVTSQDSANKPAITVGHKVGPSFQDSAMLYPWGLKSRAAVVDTLRTALSGRRYFGNQQKNICDTILVWGVSDSTTVVTATYGRDTAATSRNGLSVWVGRDTIYVRRFASSDPNNYYWRAEKIIYGYQIQPNPYLSGAERPPETAALTVPAPRLKQSYPNPASQEATISYQTARAGLVCLAVYNMLGQKIKTLVDQALPAGSYSVKWDGRNQQGQRVSSGVYFYELKTEGAQITKKLILTK